MYMCVCACERVCKFGNILCMYMTVHKLKFTKTKKKCHYEIGQISNINKICNIIFPMIMVQNLHI